MSAPKSTLPPVPPPVIANARAQAGQTRPVVASAPKTIFDGTKPEIHKARQQADSTRRSFQATLQSLRNSDRAAKEAELEIASSADTAAIFAHEGITPDVLKKIRDLAAPILAAFTES